MNNEVKFQVTAETRQAAQGLVAFLANAVSGLKVVDQLGKQTAATLSNVVAHSAAGARQLDVFSKTSQRAFLDNAQAARRVSQQTLLSSQELSRTAGGLRSAATSLTYTATLFAGPGVQQAVLPLMLLGQQVNAVSQAMKLTGIAAPVAVAAIAGITATVAIGVTAMKAYAVEWERVRSAQALAAQTSSLAGRYGEMIMRGQDSGKISDAQAEKLFAILGSADPNKLKEVSKVLREIFLPKDRTESMEKLLKTQAEMQIGALAGAEKERAEALRAKTERIKATDEELAKFKTFTELRSALIDAGRAKEVEGLTSIAEFRKRLHDQADGEFQTRMEAIAAAEDKARLDRSKAVEAEMMALHRVKEAAHKEELELIKRYQREQEQADEEFLQRAEQRRQAQMQRISANPFLTESEKYSQLKSLGSETGDRTGVRSTLGADPDSFIEQTTARLVQLQNQFGTFSQASAAMISSGIGSAIQGVSDGIMGLIDGTRTWAETWGAVLKSMAAQGIQFMVQQTAQFVLNNAKRLTVHIATESGMTAASLAQGALRIAGGLKEAVVWIIKAAAKAASSVADIPYVGWALALAAMAGVIAAGKNAIAGAREAGGPVEGGKRYLVGERGPEFFVAPEDGYVLNNRDTMQVMRGSGKGSNADSGSPVVNVANFLVANLDEVIHRAMAQPLGTKIIVQTIDGRRLDLGFDT